MRGRGVLLKEIIINEILLDQKEHCRRKEAIWKIRYLISLMITIRCHRCLKNLKIE